MKTTTKSLIFLSLILAFAVALQDGDQVAFRTHATPYHAEYQYLNAYVSDGSLHMAPSTDYATLSETWWKAHKLSDGSWAFENLGNPHNAQYIYLDANTYKGYCCSENFVYLDVNVWTGGSIDMQSGTDYASKSGTHWEIVTLVPAGTGIPLPILSSQILFRHMLINLKDSQILM